MPQFIDNIEFTESTPYGQIRTYEFRFPYRWTISWDHVSTTGTLSTIVFATRAQEADGLLTTKNGMWEIFNLSAGGRYPVSGKVKIDNGYCVPMSILSDVPAIAVEGWNPSTGTTSSMLISDFATWLYATTITFTRIYPSAIIP